MKKFNLRFADDIVVGFQSKAEADQLHPEKTRLLEFGPYAIDQRQWRGEGKPETFNFLGFTHICKATYRANRARPATGYRGTVLADSRRPPPGPVW